MTTTNRPVSTITTKVGGHTVQLHTYLTSREKTKIDKVLASAATLSADMDKNKEQEFNAVLLMDFVDEICRAVVASVDGATENAFDILLDLESGVLDEVRAEAQKVYDRSVPLEARSTKK